VVPGVLFLGVRFTEWAAGPSIKNALDSFETSKVSRIWDIRFYWHIISFLNTATGKEFKSKRNHSSQSRRRSRWECNRCACAGFSSSTRVATTHPEGIIRSHLLTTCYSKCLMFSVYVVI